LAIGVVGKLWRGIEHGPLNRLAAA
jgi:hypothetical protein